LFCNELIKKRNAEELSNKKNSKFSENSFYSTLIKLDNNEFAIWYDREKRIPRLAIEYISEDNFKLTNLGFRRIKNFKKDPRIESKYSASNGDYKSSSFTGGHFVRAGNYKHNLKLYELTFLLTNIFPQNEQMNNGIWEMLEKSIESMARDGDKLVVITATLFVNDFNNEGKNVANFQHIGNNMIAVPTHAVKIIIKNEIINCYVIPNKSIANLNTYPLFEQKLHVIEKILGLSLYDIDIDKNRLTHKLWDICKKKQINVEQAMKLINLSDDLIDIRDDIFETIRITYLYLSELKEYILLNRKLLSEEKEFIKGLSVKKFMYNEILVTFFSNDKSTVLSKLKYIFRYFYNIIEYEFIILENLLFKNNDSNIHSYNVLIKNLMFQKNQILTKSEDLSFKKKFFFNKWTHFHSKYSHLF
jgi:DNA/RNA endonuclease G (NUC1)